MRNLRKVIGLFILVLFSTTLVNIPVKAATSTITSVKVSGKKNQLSSSAGSVSFTIKVEGDVASKMRVKTSVDGKRVEEVDKTFSFEKVLEGTIFATAKLPENLTKGKKVYSFEFSADEGATWYKDGNTADITVAANDGSVPGTPTKPEVPPVVPTPVDPPAPPVPVPSQPIVKNNVLGLSEYNVDLESIGGDVNISLFTVKETKNENIRAKAMLNGNKVDLVYSALREGAKRDIKITVPQNKEPNLKEYKVVFNTTGSDTEFDLIKELTIKVKPSISKEMNVLSLTSKNTNLPLGGGKTNITIKGENLDKNKLSTKLIKRLKNVETEAPEIIKDLTFAGTDTILTGNIDFPASKDGEVEYILKLYVEGKEVKTLTFKLTDTGFDGTYADLIPKNVSIDKVNKNILIQYNGEISEVKEGIFKDSFLIDLKGDGKTIKLEKEAKVTFEATRITINTELVSKLEATSKFTIPQDVLKDKFGSNAKAYSGMLNKIAAVVLTGQVIKGDVLSSEGGEVIVKLDGANLVGQKEATKPQILALAALEMNKPTMVMVTKVGSDIKIDATVEGEGNTQYIKFNLPKNEKNIPETYLVRVSLDGGLTYSAKVGVSSFDFGRKLAATVLPKNVADPKAPILSHLTIQSYGTLGGGSVEPDTTHTDVPTGQESKKTLVHVFGANLNSKLTKIRVKDKRGVIWYPVREPNSDSMDQFILVAFGGPGIAGDGNTQLIELIAPRNIRGNNEYTYEIAVDGVHYDTSITVTATVLDDLDPGKHNPETELRTIKLSFVDEKGNVIENATRKDGQKYNSTETIMGYSWLRYKIVGITPIELDGYTLLGTDKGTVDLNSVIKDNVNIKFVYSKNKEDAVEPTPENPAPVQPKPEEPTPVQPTPEKPAPTTVPTPSKPEVTKPSVTKPSITETSITKKEDVKVKDSKKENVKTLPNTGSKESNIFVGLGLVLLGLEVVTALKVSKVKNNK